MKVIVFGGDGFCGWPTSLHLSNIGCDVLIIDNLSRRNIDNELSCNSLTPISTIHVRIQTWKEKTGKKIEFININIAKEYHELVNVLRKYNPDAVIHFAEQRAAPYSMKSNKCKRYTVENNIQATHNILTAISSVNKKIHIIHLGSTGVYGYGNSIIPIPEGYLNIDLTHKGKKYQTEIVHPYYPGSIYHMTKCMDNVMFHFFVKNDKLRITELHQGVVWGTNTKECKIDERLINRFDYDGDYGTVLNRFLIQAAVGQPLTVYGTGGQTRAFIHIQNTVQCIEIAIENPPEQGENVQTYNQLTETHRVVDLAHIISELTNAKIEFLKNPRKEAEENELVISNECFIQKKLNPIYLERGLLKEIIDIAKKYKNRFDQSKIKCESFWVKST